MAAKRRFPSGSKEWIRLGRLLVVRRGELDDAYAGTMQGYGGRVAFARDRDVNLKLVEDIELNRRENFLPATLRDIIAPAYGVTYESIRAVIDQDGDLEAAQGTPPHQPPKTVPKPAAPIRREDFPPELQELVLKDIDMERLAPYVDQLDKELAEFRPWTDDYEAVTWRSPGMSIDTKRVLISMYRMLRDEQAGSGRSRTGLGAPPSAQGESAMG